MRRFLRPTGVALGLFIALASCAPDHSIAPASGALRPASGALSADVAATSTPALVISQVYGGGGNSGAPLKNDFIELFNPGTAAVNISGWSVQYASAAGTTWQVTALSGVIPPGGYYLVQEAAGTGTQPALPTPDATGTIAMALGAGKVWLVQSTAMLSGACPTLNVVDQVSYGTAASNCGSSTPVTGTTATLSNTTAALRKDSGCEYTFNLTNDFVSPPVAPAPRNSSSAAHSCVVVVVDHVTISPASASVVEGNTAQFTAKAFDASNNELPGVAFGWSSSNTNVATVDANGLAKGKAPGDAEITATAGGKSSVPPASIHVDEAPLPDLPAVRFSELHYDNVGTDVGEAIEIEGPAGTNLTGWSVALYNGSDRKVYDTRVLDATIPNMCDGRGVVVIRYEQDGIQNGSQDGLALVGADGLVVEFLSYEGTLTALDGPAAGQPSKDIDVEQASTNPHYLTLQRRPSGRWDAPNDSKLGACYDGPKATQTNQVSFSGRFKGDAPLPVGFEDQLFGSLRSPANANIESDFTWLALNPDIATIDADGVFHAHAAGNATFRATAEDGTTNVYTLPTVVATASTTALYGNNAEFGEPADADDSDDFIIRRTEFTSSFNRNRNTPNWVSYNLEATHMVSGQDRCDCFTYDPLLPAEFQHYTTADYTGAGAFLGPGVGIDRGHLARSFDRTSGALDNARTFYFSNIIPQFSDNNQGPWANLENYLGDRASDDNKEVYIIAGPAGSKGTIKDEGIITIPEWTWKVAVIMPRDQGLANVRGYQDIEVVAVIMPNKMGIRTPASDPDAKNDWKKYLTTVNAVEALTGYDVLALLDKKIESVVEGGMQDEMALVDALVAAKKLSPGNGNSLVSKLEAAAASIDRGSNAAAVNQLEAFLHEVDAMEKSKRLDAADANTLRSAITTLITSLSS